MPAPTRARKPTRTRGQLSDNNRVRYTDPAGRKWYFVGRIERSMIASGYSAGYGVIIRHAHQQGPAVKNLW